MLAQQNLDGLPEDVLDAIKEMDVEEQAHINEEPEEKQLPPEVVDWEKSKVYNYMDQDIKRRVQRYWQNALSGVFLWVGRRYGAEVSRQDLKDMIMDEPIASNCIECYEILLTDQLSDKESQGLEVPSFMHPLCWHSAENLTVYFVHLYLCEPLFQNLVRSNYIFFPISHESGFHHTLLIFDKSLKNWFHCDSKKPKKPLTGSCFQNVKKMKEHIIDLAVILEMQIEMVEFWMTAVKDQADDMLEQGCRMKFDEKNSSEEELKLIEVPLTENEIESIKWIRDNYNGKMKVEDIKTCPQQDSLYCGLFVMYNMEKISKRETVQSKLTKDDILKFRANVVKSFVESVPRYGLSIPKTKEGAYSSEFMTKYFDKKKRINKAGAEQALKKALAETPETGEEKKKRNRNVAVLVLLNLFIKLLFPNSGGTISWDYVRVCEEVEILVLPQDGCSVANRWKGNRKSRNQKVAIKDPDRKKRDFNAMGKLKKIFNKVKEDAEEDEIESNTDTETQEKHNDGQEENVEKRTSGNMEKETTWNDIQKKELETNLQKKEEELRDVEIEKKGLEEKIRKLEKELETREKKAGHINNEKMEIDIRKNDE
ncbi:uncharacterized protein LOC133730418 [Rosa rugosa]|uniref:uncharacterized protein LOC133730418 n=1 Tax=Rosa rugosa TaxID=74645 RepID=UPI002B40C533|nr:uncharacterized protein LOC133730418 [Rosa rugosa]